jgi:hypothetical protein
MTRKFKKVPKKGGVPKKYTAGLSADKAKKRRAEIKATAKKYKAGKLSKAEMDKIAKERAKDKYKKGGSASKTPACVKKYAKSSGKSTSTLMKVYKRGMGAYYSSGSRPGQSPQSWGCGRVRSFATGKGGARKADKDLLKGKKKN